VGSTWTPAGSFTIDMTQPVCPEMLLVHVISFESVTLKCAYLRFYSNNSHSVSVSWGPAGPPFAFSLFF
jgi:hypothetical protein